MSEACTDIVGYASINLGAMLIGFLLTEECVLQCSFISSDDKSGYPVANYPSTFTGKQPEIQGGKIT